MKKLAVIFGIVLFVMAGCSDDGEMNHDVLVHRMQYVAPNADEPFNGERTFYYDSGTIQSKAEYINGYPEHIVNFYRTGEKRHVFIYKADELKSRTTWYKNGQKKFQSSGDTIREWYKNGQLKAEAHYGDDSGTLHGITQTWYKDGTLKGRENYSYGKLDGEKAKWDTDGNKILAQVYEKGKLVE